MSQVNNGEKVLIISSLKIFLIFTIMKNMSHFVKDLWAFITINGNQTYSSKSLFLSACGCLNNRIMKKMKYINKNCIYSNPFVWIQD